MERIALLAIWSRAACRGLHELFLSPFARDERQAKQICREQCPVIRECLAWALLEREPSGVWGGKSQEELKTTLTMGSAFDSNFELRLTSILDAFVESLSNVPLPRAYTEAEVLFIEFRAIIEKAS